jgi:hypothetical protein
MHSRALNDPWMTVYATGRTMANMNKNDEMLNGSVLDSENCNPGIPECARDVTRVAIGARLLCATLTPFTHAAVRDEEKGPTIALGVSKWKADTIICTQRSSTAASCCA